MPRRERFPPLSCGCVITGIPGSGVLELERCKPNCENVVNAQALVELCNRRGIPMRLEVRDAPTPP